MALAHIEREIEDPEVRKLVTPEFPFGCKRIIQASTFYPTLNRPNVTLVPHAVTRVTPYGVVGGDGIEREVDVLIFGTGFQAQNFLGSLPVTGRDGRSLHEVWGESAKALLGFTVPGFPNFFILYGPNTNGGGSAIFTDERGADAVVRAAKRLRRNPDRAIDTRPAALARYVAWVDKMNAKYLSATFHCHNYFFAKDGRNVTQWPLTGLQFSLMMRLVIPVATKRLPPAKPSQARAGALAQEQGTDAGGASLAD
jgi:cation diffusion facilitator CzcD-associated flavoprotein CzcO